MFMVKKYEKSDVVSVSESESRKEIVYHNESSPFFHTDADNPHIFMGRASNFLSR